jgi:hypothetical protein
VEERRGNTPLFFAFAEQSGGFISAIRGESLLTVERHLLLYMPYEQRRSKGANK